MMPHSYSLDDVVQKTTRPLTLWQAERGRVEIGRQVLTIAIKLDDEVKGYVFHGQGKLVLDAIVETDEGAVGKSVEKELKDPFLMLGKTEQVQQHLTGTENEDFASIGHSSKEDALACARRLFDRFFKESRVHGGRCSPENEGSIFAFQGDSKSLDTLVTCDSKLVYTTRDMVYVSDGNKVVLQSSNQVAVSANGKSIILKKKCAPICVS